MELYKFQIKSTKVKNEFSSLKLAKRLKLSCWEMFITKLENLFKTQKLEYENFIRILKTCKL